MAESLSGFVGDGLSVVTDGGCVIERYDPTWEGHDEIYPLWSLPKSCSEEFWRQHPEIVSSCGATELYFASSGAAASVLAKHWTSAERMWISMLEQSEYCAERVASPESSPFPTEQPTQSESSSSERDEEDWCFPAPEVSVSGVVTSEPG